MTTDTSLPQVIPDFMDQFGCPYSKDPKNPRAGTGNPPDGTFKNLVTGATETRSNGGNIKDEFAAKISNEPGTLSMANTGSPNSGGSQFFMNTVHNDFLDWFSPGESKHPVFGKCIDDASFKVMKAISKVPTRDDCPVTPVKMNSVTVA
jgi:cyclophilin family peptidyl-prolyl cis-trans isomerase